MSFMVAEHEEAAVDTNLAGMIEKEVAVDTTMKRATAFCVIRARISIYRFTIVGS